MVYFRYVRPTLGLLGVLLCLFGFFFPTTIASDGSDFLATTGGLDVIQEQLVQNLGKEIIELVVAGIFLIACTINFIHMFEGKTTRKARLGMLRFSILFFCFLIALWIVGAAVWSQDTQITFQLGPGFWMLGCGSLLIMLGSFGAQSDPVLVSAINSPKTPE